MKKVIIERYNEDKDAVRLPVSKAIKEELETYGKLLKMHLDSKPTLIPTSTEHSRTWRVNKDKCIKVRFKIEENPK